MIWRSGGCEPDVSHLRSVTPRVPEFNSMIRHAMFSVGKQAVPVGREARRQIAMEMTLAVLVDHQRCTATRSAKPARKTDAGANGIPRLHILKDILLPWCQGSTPFFDR